MKTSQRALTLSLLADDLEHEIRSLQDKQTAGTLNERAFDGLENLLADLRQIIILLEALHNRS